MNKTGSWTPTNATWAIPPCKKVSRKCCLLRTHNQLLRGLWCLPTPIPITLVFSGRCLRDVVSPYTASERESIHTENGVHVHGMPRTLIGRKGVITWIILNFTPILQTAKLKSVKIDFAPFSQSRQIKVPQKLASRTVVAPASIRTNTVIDFIWLLRYFLDSLSFR